MDEGTLVTARYTLGRSVRLRRGVATGRTQTWSDGSVSVEVLYEHENCVAWEKRTALRAGW